MYTDLQTWQTHHSMSKMNPQALLTCNSDSVYTDVLLFATASLLMRLCLPFTLCQSRPSPKLGCFEPIRFHLSCKLQNHINFTSLRWFKVVNLAWTAALANTVMTLSFLHCQSVWIVVSFTAIFFGYHWILWCFLPCWPKQNGGVFLHWYPYILFMIALLQADISSTWYKINNNQTF